MAPRQATAITRVIAVARIFHRHLAEMNGKVLVERKITNGNRGGPLMALVGHDQGKVIQDTSVFRDTILSLDSLRGARYG